MPQPQPSAPGPGYNTNSQPGMPVGVPFGAGWVAPAQHPHQQQQLQQPYPQHHYSQQQQQHSNPYPYPSNTPYPTPVPNTAPYATNGGQQTAPYPGSSYPHNPHQAPYPTSSSSSPHYHNPHHSQSPPSHPSAYNPNHGYTPVRTSMGLESPAGNIQHCFAELAQRKGHPIQHHYTAPRREVSSVISICLMSSIDGRLLEYPTVFFCLGCSHYLAKTIGFRESFTEDDLYNEFDHYHT